MSPIFRLIVILILVSGCYHQRSAPPLADAFEASIRPLYAAHRGKTVRYPGNSAGALTETISSGIPFIEIDIRRSFDHTYYLFHDRRLLPEVVSGPKELLGEPFATLRDDEVREVRFIGDWEILSVLQAFSILRGRTPYILLDIKGETPFKARGLIRIARSLGMEDQVIVQCQWWFTCAFVHFTSPKIKTLFRVHDPADLDSNTIKGASIVQVDPELLTPDLVKQIRGRGQLILVKSLGEELDSKESHNRLVLAGADILLTDFNFD